MLTTLGATGRLGLLELRASARRVYDELSALDRKKLKRGFLGFLKVW